MSERESEKAAAESLVDQTVDELDEATVPESLMLELWHETAALAPDRLRQGFATLQKRQPVLVELVAQLSRGLSEAGRSQAMFVLYLLYKTFVRHRGRALPLVSRVKVEAAAARLQAGLGELEARRGRAEMSGGADDEDAGDIDWIAERQPVAFAFVLHLLDEKDGAAQATDREEADRNATIAMQVLEVLDGEIRGT